MQSSSSSQVSSSASIDFFSNYDVIINRYSAKGKEANEKAATTDSQRVRNHGSLQPKQIIQFLTSVMPNANKQVILNRDNQARRLLITNLTSQSKTGINPFDLVTAKNLIVFDSFMPATIDVIGALKLKGIVNVIVIASGYYEASVLLGMFGRIPGLFLVLNPNSSSNMSTFAVYYCQNNYTNCITGNRIDVTDVSKLQVLSSSSLNYYIGDMVFNYDAFVESFTDDALPYDQCKIIIEDLLLSNISILKTKSHVEAVLAKWSQINLAKIAPENTSIPNDQIEAYNQSQQVKATTKFYSTLVTTFQSYFDTMDWSKQVTEYSNDFNTTSVKYALVMPQPLLIDLAELIASDNSSTCNECQNTSFSIILFNKTATVIDRNLCFDCALNHKNTANDPLDIAFMLPVLDDYDGNVVSPYTKDVVIKLGGVLGNASIYSACLSGIHSKLRSTNDLRRLTRAPVMANCSRVYSILGSTYSMHYSSSYRGVPVRKPHNY